MKYTEELKEGFHIKSNIDSLAKILGDINARLEKLEVKKVKAEEPKKGHKDYKNHRTKTCGKYGRFRKGETCECGGV